MVTVAPGITAPDWSLMVPEIVPASPELAAKVPVENMETPKDKIRMKSNVRLPSMKILHETHEIFVVMNFNEVKISGEGRGTRLERRREIGGVAGLAS